MIAFDNLKVGGLQTNLYAPRQTESDGGFLLFLLPGNDLPDTLTIEKTWGPEAAAKGFYLFLNRIPPSDLLIKFNALLIEALAGITLQNSSFVWVDVDKSAVPKILARVATALYQTGVVVVDRDVTIPAPEPYSGIAFKEGTPIKAAPAETEISSFVFQNPPVPPVKGQPASGPPNLTGLILALTGQGRGCLRAEALIGGEDASLADVVKNLFLMSLDPVAPFNSNRTYLTITNESFRLIESEGVIGIAPN